MMAWAVSGEGAGSDSLMQVSPVCYGNQRLPHTGTRAKPIPLFTQHFTHLRRFLQTDMNTQKTEILKFRVTSEQRKAIEAKAVRSGMSVSEYLRACALDKQIVVIEGADKVADELRRIGVNVNQIAHAVNSGFIYDAVDLTETRKELVLIWRSLNSLPRVVR